MQAHYTRPNFGWAADSASMLGGIGFGLVVGTSFFASKSLVGTPGGIANIGGLFTAMVGTYLCLVLLMLISRLPWLERSLGHDKMVLLHRTVAPYSLFLIGLHVVFTTIGYAQAHKVNVVDEFVTLVTEYPWMLPALVAFLLMVGAGVLSYKKIRRRMKYETWWVTHLYFYIAIVLGFGHQIENGRLFLDNVWLKWFWIGLYAAVGATILYGRILLPLAFSFRHRLKIAAVVQENADVVSIYITGRKLDRITAQGGQFFQWRFMVRDWWWQAHPYSLSAAPTEDVLRITVKNLGDQSRAMSTRLKPGVRVVAEGPYGIFTTNRRYTDGVVAFAAGIGITPIRAMLEHLPTTSKATVIYRALDESQAPLRQELVQLCESRGFDVHVLLGTPQEHPLTLEAISHYVPDISERDVYVCGPGGFTTGVQSLAQAAGIPENRVHHEAFAF